MWFRRTQGLLRAPLHWNEVPPVLPLSLLQSVALGLVIGAASGGLVGWLLFDAFWIGTAVVAAPLALLFLALFLRLAMLDDPPSDS